MSSARLDPSAVRTALVVLTGGIAVILDATIVSVALHQLAVDLHAGVDSIQWVSTAYLLALGCVIPTVGWLQSRIGAKRLWMSALAMFVLGSVLCSVAWSASSLIGFRVLQGIGGGAMIPLMTTMIMQAARGADRARLTSLVALPTAVGPILGPVIGGLILSVGNWRWLFLVNVPLGLAGLILAWRMLPAGETTDRLRLDVIGLILLSPGLVGVLWGLSKVGDGGFGRPSVLVPLIIGVALLLGFLGWALRRPGTALVDLQVLRSRPTWAASALMFLSGASLYGAMLLLPLYFQQVRGADALGAGLLLIPQGVGSLLSRSVAVSLLNRISPRMVTITGFLAVGIATVPFALAGADTSQVLLLAALFVRGLGLGVVVIPMMTVAFIGLEREQVPHASIVTRIAQQVGGSLGVALLAVVLTMTTRSTGSAVAAFDTAFWWTTGFTALAMLVSLALPGRAARPHADTSTADQPTGTTVNPASDLVGARSRSDR